VTGERYQSGTVQVDYRQPFADGSMEEGRVYLAKDEEGRWRWFFGQDRAFIDELIAKYDQQSDRARVQSLPQGPCRFDDDCNQASGRTRCVQNPSNGPLPMFCLRDVGGLCNSDDDCLRALVCRNTVCGAPLDGMPHEENGDGNADAVPPRWPADASLASVLPRPTEMPDGLVLTEEGGRAAEEIVATFPSPAEAAALFTEWGWQENAYQTYVGDNSTNSTTPATVEISLHRFATDTGAAQALPFFANSRAMILGQAAMPAEQLKPNEAAIVGTVADGNEASLYIQHGDVVVRITVRVAEGRPDQIAREVAEIVLRNG
jgi:hypothetical protein